MWGFLGTNKRLVVVYQRTFPITMESVDAVGIVFFGAYWNWYESVFEGLIAAASGQSWNDLLASGLAIPVVHAEIDYVKALRLSDEVTVSIKITKLGSRSVHFDARFQDGSRNTVAEAKTVNVLTSVDLGRLETPAWLEAAVESEAE